MAPTLKKNEHDTMFTIHVRLFRTPIQNSSNEVFFLAEDTDYTCLYLKEQVVKYCMFISFFKLYM